MRSQAKGQVDRLASTNHSAMGLYGRTPVYYDQNLALFSTGWVEQRYSFDRDGRLKVKWR
jgi:endoglucanase